MGGVYYLYTIHPVMKKTLIVVLLVALVGSGLYFYSYKDHRDIASEDAVFTGSAIALKESFSQPTSSSGDGVLNQTVVVTGIVSSLETNTITLNDALVAQFEQLPAGVQQNDMISVKGRCIGYDDLFLVVLIDQSTIVD